MNLHPKDGVVTNTHPLNQVTKENIVTFPNTNIPDRPPFYEIYLRMAELIAKRSTCKRLSVGCVITDYTLESVLSVGYNGNARGLANTCDSDTPGACGCIHSESNALIKCEGSLPGKVAFITISPCVNCAKMLIQAKVEWVFFRDHYRNSAPGLDVLEQGGIKVVEYNRWRNYAW